MKPRESTIGMNGRRIAMNLNLFLGSSPFDLWWGIFLLRFQYHFVQHFRVILSINEKLNSLFNRFDWSFYHQGICLIDFQIYLSRWNFPFPDTQHYYLALNILNWDMVLQGVQMRIKRYLFVVFIKVTCLFACFEINNSRLLYSIFYIQIYPWYFGL